MVPKRTIFLPQKLDNRTKTLAGLSQETVGAILYRTKPSQQGLHLLADTLYMMGRGKEHEVIIDPHRENILDDFLIHHPEYATILWHTHISGNKQLSRTDTNYYMKQLRENPYFIGMIIAENGRTTIQSRYANTLNVLVSPNPADFHTRENYLQNEFKTSAQRLGLVDIPLLQATRKKS